MSLIKTIKAQLGLSNTATQNFTLTAEAADGTMKLARGNAGATTQDVITIDSSGKVAFPQGLSNPNSPLGVGQSIVSYPTGRAFNTDYTNSTGRTIFVSIIALTTSTSNSIALLCNANKLSQGGISLNNTIQVVQGIIPPGGVYRVNATNVSLDTWTELS